MEYSDLFNFQQHHLDSPVPPLPHSLLGPPKLFEVLTNAVPVNIRLYNMFNGYKPKNIKVNKILVHPI